MSSQGFYASVGEDFSDVFTGHFDCDVPCLTGDFYAERSNTTRGLTLDLGDVLDPQTEFGQDKMYPLAFANSCQHFDDRNAAPCITSDLTAFMGRTVLHLPEYTAVSAGNRLLTFLRREVNAQVQKVNQTKFTLKAVILRQGLWCKIKVRIYQNGQGSVVEFQRCSGDTLALHGLYHQVSEFLLGHSTTQHASLGPPGMLCMESSTASTEILPLLEMVDSCQNVNLLAEAASSLNALATDPEVLKELRMPCALSILQHLRQVEDFRVAFPASCLLSAM
jgi:hypothetical protein